MELDLVFKKLILREVSYQSESLGLNLLISRVQRKYMDNRTDEGLDSCLEDMRAFFAKYQRIMGKDIEKLKEL